MAENSAKQNINDSIKVGYWEKVRFLLPITLSLALPLGYLLAYVHEVGYCNVYKVPKELIALDWTSVIIGVSAALGGSLFLVWFIAMLLLPTQPKQRMGPIRRRLYFLFLVFVFSFFIALRYLLISELIYVITYFIVLGVILFVFPVITKTSAKEKGYRRKLAAYDNEQRKSEGPFLKWLGLRGVILIMLLFGIFTFSYLEGRIEAVNQDEFYVPSTYPNSIVLRIYGDTLICANVDVELREIEKEYFIIKTHDQPPPVLMSIKTGRLGLKE